MKKLNISRKADFIYTVLACAGGMAIFAIVVNAFSTLLPAIIATYGINMTQVSYMSVADNFGQSVAMFAVTFWGDKVDKRKVIGIGAFVYGIMYLCIGLIPPFMLMLALRLFSGMCGILLDSLTSSYLADVFGERRSTALVITHMVYSAGSTVAPLIAVALLNSGFTWNASYTLFGGIATVIGLFFLALIFLFKSPLKAEHSPVRKTKHSIPYGSIFANRRVIGGLLYSFFFSGCFYFLTLLPTYLTRRNDTVFPLAFCSLLITIYSIGGLLSGLYVNAVPRIMKREKFIALMGFMSAVITMVVMQFESRAAWIIAIIINGTAVGGCYPLKFILLTDEYPDYSATVIGASTLAGALGMIVFSYIAGRIADLISLDSAILFTQLCAVVACICLTICYLKKRRTE